MEKIAKEYVLLFNTISDIIASLAEMQQNLAAVQQEAETIYIDRDESEAP